MSKILIDEDTVKLALEALEEIALAGMSVAPEMIDSKEAFHARQAWRFIGIAARALEPIKQALAEQPAQPYKGVADHTNQVTNGRMRIDPVTGDVGIGTPFSQPAQQEPVDSTQISKVWWDGEKLMAKPIPFVEFYKPAPAPLTNEKGQPLKFWGGKAEQPAQQEPVALGYMNAGHVHEMQQGRLPYGYVYPREGAGADVAVYTTPQPAQRKPLTDEEIEREWQFLHDEEGNPPDHYDFARAIEAAHGIKENT